MSSTPIEDDEVATVDLVRRFLPHFEPRIERGKHDWWSLALPYPTTADYRFSLHGAFGGERQISARRTSIRENSKRRRFWYCSLELADFRNDVIALEAVFRDQIEKLMTSSTQITEKKGLMWISYRAQYESQEGLRRLRGGFSNIGLGLGIPFVGRKRIYKSPPLRGWA